MARHEADPKKPPKDQPAGFVHPDRQKPPAPQSTRKGAHRGR